MPDQICPQEELQARFQARKKEVAAICQKSWLSLSEAIRFLVAHAGTHGPKLAAMMTGPAWGFFDHQHSLRMIYPDEAIPYFDLARAAWSDQERNLMTWLSNGKITAETRNHNIIPVSTWTRDYLTRENLWDSSIGSFRDILLRTKDLKLMFEKADEPEPELISVETKKPDPEPISAGTEEPDPLSGGTSSTVRRGRTPKIDWNVAKEEWVRLMAHHGAFSSSDPVWNSEARLVEALIRFIEEDQKESISATQVRLNLRKWQTEKPADFPND